MRYQIHFIFFCLINDYIYTQLHTHTHDSFSKGIVSASISVWRFPHVGIQRQTFHFSALLLFIYLF